MCDTVDVLYTWCTWLCRNTSKTVVIAVRQINWNLKPFTVYLKKIIKEIAVAGADI